VVVVGYGTMRKSDLTGAISSIKSEDMTMAASSSVTQMIQGKASGVQIIQQSAQPGGGLSILVRGSASTNADNQPLYVIDGFPVYNDRLEPGSGTDIIQGYVTH
jgi:TonB-dependent starch-binding outer membrane protein SusC